MYARSFAASLDPPSLQQTKLFQVIQVPYLGDPPIIKTFWLNCLIKTYLDDIAKTSSTSTNSSDEESKNKKKGKEDEVSIKEYKPLIEFVEED